MPKKPAKKTNVRGAAKVTPVESIKHKKDSRVNIPTEELRDFVKEAESSPGTLVYPRDPSLDPQLVWKGKDEQDRHDLSVPVVPVYIQEKVHPQALVENLRDTAKKGEKEPELELFADFNGIDSFEKKIDFYKWPAHWSNRMILGDSLLVMASLAEKEGLKGKVQCIYFDPPYGIKFGVNWQVSTRKRDLKDGKPEDATRQPEQIRAFRDTWSLGIHSYLAYLRDRMIHSRELLTQSGSFFLQISDDNVHLVRAVLDEVYGPENFVSMVSVRKTGGATSGTLPTVTDFIVWYAKDRQALKYRALFDAKRLGEAGAEEYTNLESADGSVRRLTDDELAGIAPLPEGGRVFATDSAVSEGVRTNTTGSFQWNGITYDSGPARNWKTSIAGMLQLCRLGRIVPRPGLRIYKRFFDDFPYRSLNNVWMDVRGALDRVYVVQTSRQVVERCLLMTTDPGDLVLDPTCGSGTTAYVAEQWGRRWITIDTSRVALALARTRLMAAKFPYYVLADSPEGVTKEAELSGRVFALQKTDGDMRKGFVYKRVPHITLKSIANNPDIKEGMSREEIDAAITKHAETELLYDKPYEDKSRIRVTGPFTVESLSPHRVLGADDNRPASEIDGQKSSAPAQFETMILDNLRKAGVQNTKRNERLVFQSLAVHPGTWIHATGSYKDASGKERGVAVSIGPEHGTVGPTQVKEAAKEAMKGVGHDTLIVCGFAFDPHVNEEVKEYGSLTVLPTRMNPDLSMGDELLKKTGAGNLFMVFGEPDIAVKKTKDGKIQVELKGLDVYDPTTGEIRSSSTDDIACWFIDTMYDEESFFVRHAYFTGADEPYEKLQRALRAEIDEAAWQSLYATISRPFEVPGSGKIAVKVINHYGDEVLKVLDVSGKSEARR